VSARYTLAWRTAARKDLKRLDRQVAARILRRLAALADDPRPPGVTHLSGYDDLWRIRVGDYRIVYTIEDDRLIITVVHVAARGQVYRDL
jgi:mRNA interferase RelE/StbE